MKRFYSRLQKGFMIGILLIALSQASIKIEGFVTDSSTNEPLIGANVYLKNTSLGSATDIDGYFIIAPVPPGEYVLKVNYIGYKEYQKSLKINEGENIKLDIRLVPEVIESEVVVVTAQAQGQQAAINQQLTAKEIKNVVSAQQIQELPDANAAESLRRLPGVSITRVGGEGNKVVIRGLAPKYNAVTIDGIKMASPNKDDRGTDLSMISSTMLEGIEVSKTITADQDADLIGGAVNFKLKEAKEGPARIQWISQGGYTGLSNAHDRFSNYKFVPGYENRFFKNKLGLFFQMNIERRNLTSNEFNADYSVKDNSLTDYVTNALYLHHIPRDKQRTNAALVLDYRLPVGKVNFSNFVSSGKTKEYDRNEILNVRLGPFSNNQHVYNFNYREYELNLIHNSLEFDFVHPYLHSTFKFAHSYSESKSPNNWNVAFYQSPANLSSFEGQENLNPRVVNDSVYSDPNSTRLHTISVNNDFSKERTLTAKADFEIPLQFGRKLSAVLKFGGKWKKSHRYFNSEVYGTNASFTSPSARAAGELVAQEFGWSGDPNSIPMTLFLDPNFDYGKLFGGDFRMVNALSYDQMKRLVDFIWANRDFLISQSPEAFAKNNYLSETNDYKGDERTVAGYFMTTFNIGRWLTLIPGIRYQELKTTYTGARGQQTTFSYNFYNHVDTAITKIHPYWLPNLNIKIQPVDWLIFRFAWSNTLSYPDFNAIIPRIDASTTSYLAWNNVNLKPIQSDNLDFYFSVSENRVGLFSFGVFRKRLKDVIYPWVFFVPGSMVEPYYLPGTRPNPRLIYQVNTYINNPYTTEVKGYEVDWQTHFWYLPGALKGLVLNVNFSHLNSEAKYPFQTPGTFGEAVDTFYVDRLVYQPDVILNITVGYDYKDFSVRLSYQYQNDVFFRSSQWPQERANTASYGRWDLSMKQRLPWYGLQLYANLNNINATQDKIVLQKYPSIPYSIEEYGMMAEFGLRWEGVMPFVKR